MTISDQRPNSKDDGMMNQLRLAVTEWWGVPAEGKKYHVYYVVPEANFASFTLRKGKLLDLIQDPNLPCPKSCANLKEGCGCRYVKFFEFHVLGIPWFCKLNLDQFRIPEDASIFRMDLDARIAKGNQSVSEYYKARGAGMRQGIRISEAIEQQLLVTSLELEIAELKNKKASDEQILKSALEEIAELKRTLADKELVLLRLKQAEENVGVNERKRARRP